MVITNSAPYLSFHIQRALLELLLNICTVETSPFTASRSYFPKIFKSIIHILIIAFIIIIITIILFFKEKLKAIFGPRPDRTWFHFDDDSLSEVHK